MNPYFHTMRKAFRSNRILLFVFLLQACRPPVQEDVAGQQEADPVQEQFVRANQYARMRHQDQIAAFLERTGWQATTSPSGLWVVHERVGKGKRIANGSRVRFKYRCSQLNGSFCYASGEEAVTATIGQGGLMAGVEEGLQELRAGAEAVFFIPPHLGHGNFGDRDRIPGNVVLIYRVKVLEVY